MNQEHKLAGNLLRLREKGGPSVLAGVVGRSRAHLVRYAAFVVFGYGLCMGWDDPGLRNGMLFALGLVSGAILKEMVFLRKIAANWGFTERVTDWKVVEELAEKRGDG